jgi:hypothetical protein
LLPLRVVTKPSEACHNLQATCIACCRGPDVSEPVLTIRLRRQSRLFKRLGAHPGRLRLVIFEVVVRRGLPLLLGPLFLVPGLGTRLRRSVGRRESCAFLGFTDAAESRAGCLLHPSRRPGPDVRRGVAFALLPGFGCGRPGFYCAAARVLSPEAIADHAAAATWFAYSQFIETYAGEVARRNSTPAAEQPAGG